MATFHIQQSFQDAVDTIFGYLPQIIGAIILLVIGHFIAKLVENGLEVLLRRFRFDRSVHTSPASGFIARVVDSPTQLLARLAYWVVMLLFISFAVSALNIPLLNTIVLGIYGYIPRVIAAIIIFVIASAITAGAERFVQRVLGRGPMAQLVSAVLPAITMSIAVFMILNQLNIARDIVNITYAALMGSIALGLALAFGLGGRDVAGRILTQAYEATQKKAQQRR